MGALPGAGARPGIRSAIALAAAGLVIAGCAASGTGSRPGPSAALRLAAYGNCADLRTGLRRATAAHVGPNGLAGGPIIRPLAGGRVPGDTGIAPPGDAKAAAPDQAPYSATNVQEPGVDEPDLVKTDGRRIVTVARGSLRVVDAASRRVTGTLDLTDGRGPASADLLLRGDRVLVVMRSPLLYAPPPYARDDAGPPVSGYGGARVVLVDIHGAPRVVSSMRTDGSFVAARQIGSVARLVVRSVPHLVFPQRAPDADATAANRKIVERAPLDAWLPGYSVTRGGGTRPAKVPCEQVSHPPSYTGTSLVTVLSVDLTGDMADLAPVSVVAGGQLVYASGTALYVTDRPEPDLVPPGTRTPRPAGAETDIYRFDLGGPGRPRFAASGSVPGELLNQYAMSEYAGNLRVATTSGQAVPEPGVTPAATESTVYVLGRHGARLERIGSVGGLGRGERVYAVRFAGPAGYVVTFRQTDPLYTLDLRDPAKPRTTGELRLSGYSAYLHPVGDGRLIGVGRQTDANGRPLGTRIALFDVRDPAAPREVGEYRTAAGWSAAESDPHAFLYWPPTGLTVVPTAPAEGTAGALVLRVTPSGLRRLGGVSQPSAAGGIERALLIGGTLWTLSPGGLQANDATTLARTGWLPLT